MTEHPRQLRMDEGPWRPVSVLDEDVGLGEALSEAEFESARQTLVAPAIELAPGSWKLELDPPPAGAALGLMVLYGLIARRQEVGESSSVEFLGPGDVLRPWSYGSEQISALPLGAAWDVARPTTLALLGDDFSRRAAMHPEIFARVVERVVERGRSLAFALAIRQLVRVDERLLLTLWHLADRWGRTRPDGRVIPLPELNHELLALMVSARRPSVTTALGRLRALGLVDRGPGGAWVLHGEPPAELAELRLGPGAKVESIT